MFTGIIEDLGQITKLSKAENNLNITLNSKLVPQLKIDQSIAHNGVCLTVIDIDKQQNNYTVTAIDETLQKTSFKDLKVGDLVNLERAMKLGDRLDGHLVQGHIDQIGQCIDIEDQKGSWLFTFEYAPANKNITIEKGSITVNGVSLTVVDSKDFSFKVAIIPYTYEHTNFRLLKKMDLVNLEFDLIGKYLTKLSKQK